MSILKLPVKPENSTTNFNTPIPSVHPYLSLEKSLQPLMPKVLSIDDSEVCQKVNCIQLKKLGCLVEAVETAKEALEKIAIPYEIIFTEVCLFDFSGEALVDFIRYDKRSANKKTPIVAVSSWFEPSFKDNYCSMGIDCILIKPILLKDFKNILKKYNIIDIRVMESSPARA